MTEESLRPKLKLRINSDNIKSLALIKKLKGVPNREQIEKAAAPAKPALKQAINTVSTSIPPSPVKQVSLEVPKTTLQPITSNVPNKDDVAGIPPLPLQQEPNTKPKKKPEVERNPYVPNKDLPEWLQRYNGLLHQVNRRYSRLFVAKEVKPLAIGIHKEIQDKLQWDNETTKFFFKTYVRTKKYKAALVEGAKRYDVQGNAVGVVTKAEVGFKKSASKAVESPEKENDLVSSS